MNIKTFIDRPILSCVVSVAVLIVGLISLNNLPVEQYPDIAPPTVRVSAKYPGASAETIQKSVVVPLEEAINGVENMMYMTSSAANSGSANVSIIFRQGTDPDMAVVNVQNRVSEAQSQLPAEVIRSGVNVRKRQTGVLMTLSLYSPDDTYSANFLSNYLKINIEPRLSRVAGVGEITVFGSDYSMRIWLDPSKMAKYGLVPSDVVSVLDEQNIEAPTGTLGSESDHTFQYTLKYRGRYEEEPDFENMVVRSLPGGEILRLKDIATIELGALNYSFDSELNEHPACNFMVVQTAGSNANEVIKEVEKVIEDTKKDLPKGMEIVTVTSVKDFLDASIHEVIMTLLIALLLVVLVVYFFLHDFKATLIPSLSILVSLVGTFAFIYLAGFSLNLLTLFALVLVIGTVVDASIVVVEAVQAKFDEGYTSPYKATVDAMKGLTMAILTTSAVFMAVFIPVCFMGGTAGIFYTQFGLTMAAAVAISCINSLTTCPALCALLLRPREAENTSRQSFSDRFHFGFNRVFNKVIDKYMSILSWLFKHKWLAFSMVVASIAGLFILLSTTRRGLVPQEDLGTIIVNVQCPPGVTLAETTKSVDLVEEAIKGIPQIERYSRNAGANARHETTSSAGSFNIRLKDWSERTGPGDDVDSVIEEIYRRTSHIKTASINLSTSPMIAGYGSGSGFEMYVQDKKGGNIEDLLKYTREFIDAIRSCFEIIGKIC